MTDLDFARDLASPSSASTSTNRRAKGASTRTTQTGQISATALSCIAARHISHGGKAWHPVFLEALAVAGNITAACRATGVSRRAVYDHMSRHPDFAEAVREEREIVFDMVEDALVRRAVDHSDTAAIFLLKANRRAVYGQRLEVTSDDSPSIRLEVVTAGEQEAEIARILRDARTP